MRRIKYRQLETEAFEYVDALFQTALQFSESRSEAADVVNHVYASVFGNLDTIQGSSGLKLELFRTLIRRIRTGVSVVPACASPLACVSVAVREVVLLVDCQGFSYSEAAAILGVASETVADRVKSGRTQLLQSELISAVSDAVSRPVGVE